MAYTTSNKYKEVIYSGNNDNNLSFKYGEDYIEDSSPYISSLKLTNNLLKTTNTTFTLDNFVSNEIVLEMHDYPIQDLTKEFYFELGSMVDGSYEYVPIGYYKIKDNPTTANGKTKYKLFDRAINFDFNYDAEPLISSNGGSVTILKLLQDICSKANVELATINFLHKDKLVGIYDNSITARTYVSYIAELTCSIAKIGRDGKLYLIPIKKINNNSIKIDEDYINNQMTTGDTFKISKVSYENGLTIFTKGDDTADTLFINSANPYISTQEDIDDIYNQIVGFEIMSLNTSKILGDISIDPFDFIEFELTDDNGNVTKKIVSLGQYEFTFNGVMYQTFNTTINRTSKKVNATPSRNDAKYKRLRQEIDSVDGSLKIISEKVEEIEVDTTLTKQFTGNPITIEDAGPYDLESIEIEGKSYQETRSGKNLYMPKKANYTVEGVSYSYNLDGTINLSGTANAVIYITNDVNLNNTKFVDGETYTISINKIIPNGITFKIELYGDSYLREYSVSNNTNPKTFTINLTDVTRVRYVTQINKDVNVEVSNIGIQVEKGSTPTEYEQYGASPSPEFPSEIKNVEGVTNEFNIKLARNVGVITNNNDGTLTLANNTNSSGYAYSEVSLSTFMPNAKVGETYKMLFKSNSSKNATSIYLSGWNDYLTVGNTFELTQQMLDSKVVFYGGYNEVTTISDFIITKDIYCKYYVPYGGKKLLLRNNNNNYLQDINFYNWVNNSNATQEKNDEYIKVIMPSSPKSASGIYLDTWSGSKKGNWKEETAYLVGKNITYSFYAKADKEREIYFQISDGIARFITLTTEWKRYSVKIIDFKNTQVPTFYCGNKLETASYYIKDIMLQEGDLTDYEPYKENTALVDMNKKNLFDKNDVVQGYLNENGTINSGATESRTSNFIEIKTNTTYSRTSVNGNVFFDENKKFISYAWSRQFTTPNNAKYVRVTANTSEIDNFKLYEGIDTSDYYSFKEEDTFKDGLYTQKRAKVVLNGSEGWASSGAIGDGTYYRYTLSLGTKVSASEIIAISNYFKGITYNNRNSDYINTIYANGNIGINTNVATSVSDFKTWLSNNPIEVEYILTTSIEHNLNYELLELHKGYNNITTNDDLEPNMSITYLTDSKMNAQYATKGELNILSNEVNLKVEAKIDDKDLTSAEIIARINADKESEAVINADKISLEGKEINMTSDDIIIESDNLKIDKYGNIKMISVESENPEENATFIVTNKDESTKQLLVNDIHLLLSSAGIAQRQIGDNYFEENLQIVSDDVSGGIRKYYMTYVNGKNYLYTFHLGDTNQNLEFIDFSNSKKSVFGIGNLIVDNVDILNRYSNLGINTKGGIGLNASGNTYIRTTLEDGKLYQLVGTPTGLLYQHHDGTGWNTLWNWADSGWVNVPLASGVSAGTLTGTPKYRKVMNKVDIKGSFAFTKGSSAILLGTLPTGFRPPEQFYFFAPLGGTRIARCYITTSGQIYCEWIYDITTGSAYTGSIAWTSFNVSFYVD